MLAGDAFVVSAADVLLPRKGFDGYGRRTLEIEQVISSQSAIDWQGVHVCETTPHTNFLVFGHILVNFGRKIKIDSVLETGESRAYHAYSIVVYQWPITLVSVGLIE